MRIASAGRVVLWACLGYFAATSAFAAQPKHHKTKAPTTDKAQEPGETSSEKERTWAALIEQAKAHGGVETKLNLSASYVFKHQDGFYVTFTRLLAPNKPHWVCIIAEDENASACIEWENGELRVGQRADPATPWTSQTFASYDAFVAAQPGFGDKLLSVIKGLVLAGGGGGRGHGGRGGLGYYRTSVNGNVYWVSGW
jgi:hypothetical protein